MAEIDVVIPAHSKDFGVLRHAVRSVLRHVTPVRRVHVVSAAPFRTPDERVRWLPEPASGVLPTLAAVREKWEGRGATADRAPWLYQQFLKLGASRFVESLTPSYLVLDADIIFLRAVSYDPDRVGRFPYSRSWEMYQPYRDTYGRLFGRQPASGTSFIAHHMLFDQSLVNEMLDEIEQRHGTAWTDAIMGAINPMEGSAFSEWETYGWWVTERHPEAAVHRQVFWHDVRVVPRRAGRAVQGLDVDFVAAHHWMRQSRWQRAGAAAARFVRNE